MAEARLRQVWAGLMPSFPEPATLLDISDPDERAVTMLLKTLYVLFKGEKGEMGPKIVPHRVGGSGLGWLRPNADG